MTDDEGNEIETSSAPTFGDTFAKMAFNFGGNYLTLKGQEAIAKAQLDAQVRLNGYAAVNPSLGPVAPGAATRIAAQTPAQSWLPWGQPITGTTGNTATATPAGTAPTWQKPVLVIGVILLAVLVLVKIIRK